MFDVSWNDPTRETVGQRRSRKDHQSSISRGSSVRSSSSSGSSTQKPSSLFGLFGSGKRGGPRAPSRAKASALGNDKVKASRRVSSYTTSSSAESSNSLNSSNSDTPGATTKRTTEDSSFFLGAPYKDPLEGSFSDESVFSGWTGRSTATKSSWGSSAECSKGPVIQPLSPNSFVTQSTEVVVEPSEHFDLSEQVARTVHISSGTMPYELNESSEESKEGNEPSTFDFPIPSSHTAETASPASTIVGPITVTTKAQRRQSDSWRPPKTWNCTSEESLPKQLPTKCPMRKRIVPTTEMTHLHKNIKKMEAASAKIFLERLKEEWLEVADASVYKDLELEKQLWLLSALRNLRNILRGKSDDASPTTDQSSSRGAPQKILSLYENHACASLLSALSPSSRTQIHHLSTNPLSPKKFPNIYPYSVPSPSPSLLSFASQNFTSIHAFSLPSHLPSASIPAVLKDCHRCLLSTPSSSRGPFSSPSASKPAAGPGVLHLTLIDPLPQPSTLGPRLRSWLENHLLFNLEKSFRCTNPLRLIPIWLADAGLRGEGSTISKSRFLAAGGEGEGGWDEREELKSVVGRMLWKEMWGGWVRSGIEEEDGNGDHAEEGTRWWWDEEALVEECMRMGTFWEYAFIEAVKQG